MFDSLRFYVLYFFLYMISLMPMPLLYLKSNGLAWMLSNVFRYREKVIDENLKKSFPDKSQAERDSIKKRFYRHFSDLIFENIKSISQSPAKLEDNIETHNAELLEKIHREGRSALLLLGHYANWEYVKISLYLHSPFLNQAVYRPLKDPVADRLLRQTRNRYDGVLIAQNEMGRKLLGDREKQTLTIILYDQSPSNPKMCKSYSFLNQETLFYEIVNKLAARTGDAVLFGKMSKTGRGKYRLRFEELNEGDPIGDYVKKLEEEIREDPALWLWSHRRWKAKKKIS